MSDSMNDEEKSLVPRLRFPEFREAGEWKENKMGKVLKESPRPITMNEEKEYSLVTVKRRYGGVVSRGILKGKSIKVKSQFSLEENDFLISKRQIVHCACGVVPKPLAGSIVSNEYSVLRAREGFDIFFLEHFSRQPIVSRSFLKCSIGIVIEKMLFKLNDWLKEKFLFPPIAEQQKIADSLSSLDALIAAQADKLDALKTHKKGLMQQLFPREGETVPCLRFPEFRGAGEWEQTNLEQLVDFRSGGTPSKANPAFWSGSIPWVSAKDMKQLFLDDTEDHISTVAVDDGAKMASPGTLLMLTRGMTLLKDVPICVLRRGMSFNQDVKALRPKKDMDGLFLAFSLLANLHRLLKMVDIAGHGTGKLNTDELKLFELVRPQSDEQQKIANCLSSLDTLIAAQSDKFDALKTHKKGLMQQLFPSPEA